MATITVTPETIEVGFTSWERLWTRRERLTLPVAAVRHAALVDRPLSLARGARNGFVVSGFAKFGTWGVFRGPRQLVAARRGEPGLHLVLDRAAAGGEFDEVILSAAAAPEVVRELAGRR